LPKDIKKYKYYDHYNCGGIAIRTYDFKEETDVNKFFNDKGKPINCDESPSSGHTKCRLFEIQKRIVQKNVRTGKVLFRSEIKPDWHVSCGVGKSCPEKFGGGVISHGNPDDFKVGSMVLFGPPDWYSKDVRTFVEIVEISSKKCFSVPLDSF
jgi:hypothetical protein